MKRICLVVADATRARIYTYEQLLGPDGPHEQLLEACDLVDPQRRLRARDLFSDNSGANYVAKRGYSFDDHRQGHLDQLDSNFAKQIAEKTARVTHDGGYRALIVIASSRMLGELRHLLEPLQRTMTITELERDFTKLATAALRDHLADLELLPPRPRLAFANR